jgi:proteasome accessory factor B
VSRKSERLVNLTIALLATKRWLTKEEIFASIDGYEGESDSKERMFERDKDDLRQLGIEIEVGTFDPLFEDEVGYRIRPEKYSTKLQGVTEQELALISLASNTWRGAVLDSEALSALNKLRSFGVDSDLDSIPALNIRFNLSDSNFQSIVDAIAVKKSLTFDYMGEDGYSKSRIVNPYGVGTKNGFWYLAGFDCEKTEIRTFRLDRVTSEITMVGKQAAFSIPSDFHMREVLTSPEPQNIAEIKVRKDKGVSLRAQATSTDDGEEWSHLLIPFISESDLLSQILWHLDDVVVLSPESLKIRVISSLEEIVKSHG